MITDPHQLREQKPKHQQDFKQSVEVASPRNRQERHEPTQALIYANGAMSPYANGVMSSSPELPRSGYPGKRYPRNLLRQRRCVLFLGAAIFPGDTHPVGVGRCCSLYPG